MKLDLTRLAVLALSAGLFAGCDNSATTTVDPAAEPVSGAGAKDDHAGHDHADDAMGAMSATAEVKPAQATTTQPATGAPTGTVTFTQEGEKMKVVADLKGLTPNGTHGFHIHEKGDLSAPDLSSAGGHYNPEGHAHGAPATGPAVHAGDLGNIKADAEGNAKYEVTVDNITIDGEKNPIIGKAVIIHAKADDLKSQPSGDAGARIGGGVIEVK